MPTRFLLVTLMLVLGTASIAHAFPTTIAANLTYGINVGWSFESGTSSGRIFVDRMTSRRLAKLNTFTVHLCDIIYDPESKIEAANGTFYTLLRIGKCN